MLLPLTNTLDDGVQLSFPVMVVPFTSTKPFGMLTPLLPAPDEFPLSPDEPVIDSFPDEGFEHPATASAITIAEITAINLCFFINISLSKSYLKQKRHSFRW